MKSAKPDFNNQNATEHFNLPENHPKNMKAEPAYAEGISD
jgi:hypothetical protein